MALSHSQRNAELQQSVIDLPALRESNKLNSGERPKDIVSFEWKAPQYSQQNDGRCTAIVTTYSGDPNGSLVEVPCSPQAFTGSSAVQSDESALTRLADQYPRAVIRCSREQGLDACARLQWVVAEHGFHVAAAVAVGDETKPLKGQKL